MRRRRKSLQVSMFPFLAVLLCAMGALILVLLVMDRRSKQAALQRAQGEARRQLDDQVHALAERRNEYETKSKALRQVWEKKRDALLARVSAEEAALQAELKLIQARLAKAAQRVDDEEGTVAKLRLKLQGEQARLVHQQEALQKARKDAASVSVRMQLTDQTKAQLANELVRLEKSLKDLKEARQRDAQTYSVIPYFGKHGESRKPMYIECSAAGVCFHPDKLLLDGSIDPGRVRVELIGRAAVQTQRMLAAGAKDTRPYVMLLVRPDGIHRYYLMQAALRSLSMEYGYEFIDADWILQVPTEGPPPPTQIASLQPQGIAPWAKKPVDVGAGNGTFSNGFGGTGRYPGAGQGGSGGYGAIGGSNSGGGPVVPGAGNGGNGGYGPLGGSGAAGAWGNGAPGGANSSSGSGTAVQGTGPFVPGVGSGGSGGYSRPGGTGIGPLSPGGGTGVQGASPFVPGASGTGGGYGQPGGSGTGTPSSSGNSGAVGSSGPAAGLAGGLPFGPGGGNSGSPGGNGPDRGGSGMSGSGNAGSGQSGGNGYTGAPGTGTPGVGGYASAGLPGQDGAGGRGTPGNENSAGGPGSPSQGTGGPSLGMGQGVPGVPGAGGTGSGAPGMGGPGSGTSSGQRSQVAMGAPQAYNSDGSVQPLMGAGASGPGNLSAGGTPGTGGAGGAPASGQAGAIGGPPLLNFPSYGKGGVAGGPATQTGQGPMGSSTPPPPPAANSQAAREDDNTDRSWAGSRSAVNPAVAAAARGNGGGGGGRPGETPSFAPEVIPGSTPRKPAQLRPARLGSDGRFVIFIECLYDRVVIYPSRRQVGIDSLNHSPNFNPLLKTVEQMIARRTSTLQPGEKPPPMQVRFLVHTDGERSLHLAYPALESVPIEKVRTTLQPEDNVEQIVSTY